ncbi:helix-turn-helix domain-containing protein [Streptomyces sp. C10-9-1]|uniref:helix-turn-helix domain-containing protein n=1 Tax=Streptomyces sp. C10-9-1 TaxID=1859285 RepID=UPI0021138386|nr:helix-turn-helix domain-containing protein [Streptomyces sp. C10-9-1]MCQ6552301.1 helix-turn-helix domain-containing protein [Streptomyces sp. C10-9-1]
MDTENPSAHPRATSRNDGNNHRPRRAGTAARTGGVVHDNSRHTTRFTVIGNHLAQHTELSLLAIGLAVHIQSLPGGACVSIRTLAARFPEGTARIAAALRELEAHGYLRRSRERTGGGRIVTRTVSCNQPGRARGGPGTVAASSTAAGPPAAVRRPRPERGRPGARSLPPVPRPAYTSPALLADAAEVLAGLRRQDPRLLLSAADAAHLAPGVAAWLERELTPAEVGRALAADLPGEPLHRPAALLAHRLTAKLPPLPPFRAPAPPEAVRHPLQNCDSCDHAFRGPSPGTCPPCTPGGPGP